MPFCNFPKRHNTEEKKFWFFSPSLFHSFFLYHLDDYSYFFCLLVWSVSKTPPTKKKGKSKNLITITIYEIVMMWWLLLCGFISHWSRREFHTRNKTLSPPFKPNPLFPFLVYFFLLLYLRFSDPIRWRRLLIPSIPGSCSSINPFCRIITNCER